jgi:hypothetical protein
VGRDDAVDQDLDSSKLGSVGCGWAFADGVVAAESDADSSWVCLLGAEGRNGSKAADFGIFGDVLPVRWSHGVEPFGLLMSLHEVGPFFDGGLGPWLALAAGSELRWLGRLASVQVQCVAAQSEVKADCLIGS